MKISVDTSDIAAALTVVRKVTEGWTDEKRAALYDDLEEVIKSGGVDVDFSGGVAFAAVSAPFLNVLKKHGLGELDVPEVGRS